MWWYVLKITNNLYLHNNTIIFHAKYGTVCIQLSGYSAHPFLLWWLWEYVYLIVLPSSNRKYNPFANVYGYVMKQWYALDVFSNFLTKYYSPLYKS